MNEMAQRVSATKLKRSYEKILASLPENVRADFSLSEYEGKHVDCAWKKYPFVCMQCNTRFERVLQGKIVCQECTTFTRPGRQTSWEDLVQRFREIHGDKYEYPIIKPDGYHGQRTIIDIVCPEHGIFSQKVSKHVSGNGCLKCRFDGRRLEAGEFIRRSNEIHGQKYDYSQVKYVSQYDKVKIVCPTHGLFEQAPGHHMYDSSGCPECAAGKQTSKAVRKGAPSGALFFYTRMILWKGYSL